MSRKSIKLDKIIGEVGYGEYYAVNEIFYNHDDLIGATGTILRPVSNQEKERMTDPQNGELLERFYETWKGAVDAGETELGLEDWVSEMLRCHGVEMVFDLSDYDIGMRVAKIDNQKNDIVDPDNDSYAEFSECIGGGRVFSRFVEPQLPPSVNMMIMRDQFDRVLKPQLLKAVILAEMGKYDDAVKLARGE